MLFSSLKGKICIYLSSKAEYGITSQDHKPLCQGPQQSHKEDQSKRPNCPIALLQGNPTFRNKEIVMSHLLDRQPTSKIPISRMSKILKHLSRVVDVQRSKFHKARHLTFYSHSQLSYSRIDLCFTPKAELHRIEDIEIQPITISYHALLALSWDTG